jgi:peptide/nickel transport system ATP-binding protein
MERASRRDIFYRHHHPYTEGLLTSLPSQGAHRLTPIPGTPPSLIGLPSGCPFAPRCSYAFDRCHRQAPPLLGVYGDPGHESACWLSENEPTRAHLRAVRGVA